MVRLTDSVWLWVDFDAILFGDALEEIGEIFALLDEFGRAHFIHHKSLVGASDHHIRQGNN